MRLNTEMLQNLTKMVEDLVRCCGAGGGVVARGAANGPITIAIRARFEYDSTTIRVRYNILRGVMCIRAIMNMSILSRCCRML